MTSAAQRAQIDENYDFLQRTLALLLPEHEGRYALLRDRTIVEFFDRAADAYGAALDRFPDRIFSIQEVTAEPLDLGFLSHAGA